jgi:hypothetical protein
LLGDVAAISAQAAVELAAQLDLDVDEVGICHACLSVVSFPLRAGDERETRRATNEFAPMLWDEGLEAPVRKALERARAAGVADADAAARDIEARGGRSITVKAIVRRLAADLWERSQGDLLRMGFKPWPPADRN